MYSLSIEDSVQQTYFGPVSSTAPECKSKALEKTTSCCKKKINKAHIQCIGKSTELPRMGMYSPEYTCMFKCQLMQLSLLSFHLSKCSNCFH